MTVNILSFGIARDILGGKITSLELAESTTVGQLCEILSNQYPSLKEVMSYSIAVNQEYADSEIILKKTDEIAIIPPVSGG